ncbi:hypothetical protein XENTR_v10023797 [Xenopus tropicalis]|nr:hypothetical protein XENTR_v10023797 [Xenopus tropicalis]
MGASKTTTACTCFDHVVTKKPHDPAPGHRLGENKDNSQFSIPAAHIELNQKRAVSICFEVGINGFSRVQHPLEMKNSGFYRQFHRLTKSRVIHIDLYIKITR